MQTITRNRVMLRARYGWAKGTVPFDRTALHPSSRYRQDAAGYISMCWGLPKLGPGAYGGLNTVSLESGGYVEEIRPTELKPGDAIGFLGPGSVGTDGGVVALFETWLNGDYTTNYVICWAQLPEASPGPVQQLRPWHGPSWHCYRYKYIVD